MKKCLRSRHYRDNFIQMLFIIFLLQRALVAQLAPSQAKGAARAQIVMLSNNGGCAAGIIVGYDDRRLYVATADHVRVSLARQAGPVSVVFEGTPHERHEGTFMPQFEGEEAGDLAVLTVERDLRVNILLNELDFRILSPVPLPPTGSPVSSIGCGGDEEWTSGNKEALLPSDQKYLHFQSDVNIGQSGGGLFNEAWELIGMPLVFGANGDYARTIESVIQSLRGWQIPVELAERLLSQRSRAANEIALEQSWFARAQEFVAYAKESLGEDPERSILLAIEAINTSVKHRQPPLESAVNALHEAILTSRVRSRITDGAFSISSVAITPDATRIATAGITGVSIWDLSKGRKISTLLRTVPVAHAVTFSPDGKRVAATANDVVKIWEASNAKELLTLRGHTHLVDGVAFSPDGMRVATASLDGTAKVWDASTGQELTTLRGHDEGLHGVSFSPDGRRIATASSDATARIWDAASGKELLCLRGHLMSVYAVAFSPDGKRIATASPDHTAKVWDAISGEELLSLRGHSSNVTSVAFSPDGSRLATSSFDGTSKIWNAVSGMELATLRGHAGEGAGLAEAIVNNVAFPPDGSRVLTAGADGTVRIWNTSGDEEVATVHDGHFIIESVAFSPDGQRLVTDSAWKARIWDANTGLQATRPDSSGAPVALILNGHQGAIHSVAFSPDGKHVATASDDRTAKIWNAQTGQEQMTLTSDSKQLRRLAYSPDGRRLATSSWGETVIWDTTTGQKLVTLEAGPDAPLMSMESVAFTADGQRLATLDANGQLRIWDATNGKLVTSLRETRIGGITGLAFSADGKRMAMTAAGDAIKIFDSANLQLLITLRGHSRAGEIAFSPNSKSLAVAEDRTVKIFDVLSGEEMVVLRGHSDQVTSLAFSPDGKHLATASNDETVQIFNLDIKELLDLGWRRISRSPQNFTKEECQRFFRSDTCKVQK